jgi:hypothetical protein
MNKKLPNVFDTEFCKIKERANKIKDLNKRELFLCECLTCYKQALNEGNMIEQISDEICLTQRRKELLCTKKNTKKEDFVKEISEPKKKSLKVKVAIIWKFLKELCPGITQKDRTQICKLFEFITENSYQKIYKNVQEGICLTDYHSKEIDEANKILKNLDVPISIDKGKAY